MMSNAAKHAATDTVDRVFIRFLIVDRSVAVWTNCAYSQVQAKRKGSQQENAVKKKRGQAMATKKDSIQEERIQDASAPRAEPGAANKTIPRRDLLTGAALVLVGSASGCSKSQQAPAASASDSAGKQAPAASASDSGGTQKLLRTQFMEDFTAEFIGDPAAIQASGQVDKWPDPNRKWPVAKPQQTQVDIAADYATFVKVLMAAGYVMLPLPAPAPGSLEERIGQFIKAKNWPNDNAVPAEFSKLPLTTVHLVEISVIQDRLLKAIYSFNPGGTGGGPGDWPPH
jgi:hypothetical protein